MDISLCMIVKNEESNLDSCLKSIKDMVDEIVVVDTGSSDRTKEVAQIYTDKVYDFAWSNDFSKARNFSIEKASNDWVLILDADEIVTCFDSESVRNFISGNQKCVGRIKRVNIFEDDYGTKKYFERVNRLFNTKNFHYEGIIHEQVISQDRELYDARDIDICADHIGYTREVINRTKKIDRNLELLTEAVKVDNRDPYLYYQLGKTCFMAKKYKDANIYFKKALELGADFRLEYVEDLVESYGYSLVNSGQYAESLTMEQYKKYYGLIPDYNFLMGIVYMNNAMFDRAVNAFKACEGDVEGKIEGVSTFLPNYNIGVIYECLGYIKEAASYYKKCGNYAPAVKRLKGMGM